MSESLDKNINNTQALWLMPTISVLRAEATTAAVPGQPGLGCKTQSPKTQNKSNSNDSNNNVE